MFFSLLLHCIRRVLSFFLFLSVFFFNDTATTEIYTLFLHDALPISWKAVTTSKRPEANGAVRMSPTCTSSPKRRRGTRRRSEEHTSELQSLRHLVCRLLLEKKKKNKK